MIRIFFFIFFNALVISYILLIVDCVLYLTYIHIFSNAEVIHFSCQRHTKTKRLGLATIKKNQ